MLVVVAAYTVAIIALVGGGDDADESTADAAPPPSALERQVTRHTEGGRVPQRDETDVEAFRAAQVVSAECDGGACAIAYSVAVPGRGRIALQQVDIVRRIFGQTTIDTLELQVVRGQPTGPHASPKSEEETPLNIPLFETKCERGDAPANVDWNRFRSAQAAFSRACEVRSLFQGGPGGGGGAGGE